MRWHAKPPPGERCDVSTGWHSDRLGAPVIDMCRSEAVETCRSVMYGRWIYVCAVHRDALVREGTLERNPRRRQ